MQNWLKKNTPLCLILVISAVLRFVNLGYSDFQGDEIKALFTPDPGQNITTFLMEQRKGPVQFIVTGIIKLIDQNYTHHYIDRLPFAIAGFLAVFFFYKFVEAYFDKKLAFYSALFLATNGFFVAFSRVIQYQSFVILFMILALYMFTLARKAEAWKVKGLYLGFIFWSLAILSHYDGLFIAPFALYLLWPRLKDKHLWFSIAISGLMLAAFYIPFVFYISQGTMAYWQGRLEGIEGKTTSSRYLFKIYQPAYVFYFYALLGLMGFIKLVLEFVQSIRNKNFFQNLHNQLSKYIFVILWAAFPTIIFEKIVNIPGTHIYTYLVPLIIIVALGIVFIEDVINRFVIYFSSKFKLSLLTTSKIVVLLGLTALFAFISLQSFEVFVDHSVEYPWASKKFLFYTLQRPLNMYHHSLLGFPYNRHWDEIRNLVLSSENNGYYSTNEKVQIAGYYIPLKKDPNYIGYYIFIYNPQSFITKKDNDRVYNWMKTHPPVKIYYDSSGEVTSKVYYLY
jgi:4-amino-4-deoxy-L-arabinose transferase-like glycosyltransferase